MSVTALFGGGWNGDPRKLRSCASDVSDQLRGKLYTRLNPRIRPPHTPLMITRSITSNNDHIDSKACLVYQDREHI
jgi:hypothetical protein